MLAIYTLCHFLVDFGSGWAIYHGAAYSSQGLLAIIVYNFLAFALQFPLGFIADVCNRNAVIATTGCLLVALACVLPLSPLLVVSLAGLGNALFHLGGGIDVLNSSAGKYGPLGIFVSTGALGIFYGCRCGTGLPELGISWAVVLTLAGLVILVGQYRNRHARSSDNDISRSSDNRHSQFSDNDLSRSSDNRHSQSSDNDLSRSSDNSNSHITRSWSSDNSPLVWPSLTPQYALIALSLFIVVCMRSYMGFALSLPWKSLAPWGTAALVALFAGKFCGGLLADRWGVMTTSAVTLILAALLFVYCDNPWAGLSAIWLFNMTMPITLGALVAVTPGCKGGAFGALTLGLFLGALPHLLDCDPLPHTATLYVLITLVSLCLLLVALKNGRDLSQATTRQQSQKLLE